MRDRIIYNLYSSPLEIYFLKTLQEYILITQIQRKIECYRREPSGFWSKQSYKAEEEVEFRSVNYRCPIDDIYRKVPGLS